LPCSSGGRGQGRGGRSRRRRRNGTCRKGKAPKRLRLKPAIRKERVIGRLTALGIYAMRMGEDTMELANPAGLGGNRPSPAAKG